VDRPAGRDGIAAAQFRAAAGDPGAAGPDPYPAAAGPRSYPGVAAAGEAAEGALVKLSSVVHSLARTRTARVIVEAIADGGSASGALAGLAAGRVRAGRGAIAAALGGMQVRDHHRMLIRVHLDHIALLDRSVAAVEDEIEAAWTPSRPPGAPTPPARPARTPAARLTEIPGVSLALARAIIAETGLDMSIFPTAAHLASWAGLAPVASQSGSRTRKPAKDTATPTSRATAPRPRPAPPGPARSSASGSAACPGAWAGTGPNALSPGPSSSSSHWHLLSDPGARFGDLGPGWHDNTADRDRKIRAQVRQLQSLGLTVELSQAAA
jgi:transposase